MTVLCLWFTCPSVLNRWEDTSTHPANPRPRWEFKHDFILLLVLLVGRVDRPVRCSPPRKISLKNNESSQGRKSCLRGNEQGFGHLGRIIQRRPNPTPSFQTTAPRPQSPQIELLHLHNQIKDHWNETTDQQFWFRLEVNSLPRAWASNGRLLLLTVVLPPPRGQARVEGRKERRVLETTDRTWGLSSVF